MNERAKSIAQSITVIFAILSAFAQLGNSQFRQPVKVRLTDPGGRPLKNAELNISSPFGNFHGLTDSLGGYKLPGVAPGRYQIDVSFEGSVFERTITVEQRIALSTTGRSQSSSLAWKRRHHRRQRHHPQRRHRRQNTRNPQPRPRPHLMLLKNFLGICGWRSRMNRSSSTPLPI